MTSKLKKHFNRWNKWRKLSADGRMHKLLVLIGFVHSPTFALVLDDETEEQIHNRFEQVLRDTEPIDGISTVELTNFMQQFTISTGVMQNNDACRSERSPGHGYPTS